MKEKYNLTVDLHTHLFIKKGLGWMFKGDFEEPLKAKDWKSRFLSKANEDSLKQSGIGLVIASLYAHPLLVPSIKNSIRQQITQAQEFVKRNNDWFLAKNPLEAKNAYNNGKKIMILSLEGAGGVLETEEDIEEFVDKLGISIVTPIHLSDDRFGGSAFVGNQSLIFNTLPYLRSIVFPKHKNGVRINPKGLTNTGKSLIKLLVKHNVWIDMCHSSLQTYLDIASILTKTNQPHLFSHTLPQKFVPIENSISDEQLDVVKKTHGIVGLGTANDFLELVVKRYRKMEAYEKFKEAYIYTSQRIGVHATVLGPDFNGGSPHLPAPTFSTKTNLDTRGFWNIGQEKDLWDSLENNGVKISKPRCGSIEYFIKSWEKVFH